MRAMQEFSSISVSSFDAPSLAERLTEQSSLGWTVVAIVPAGSSITAYLSRPTGAASSVDAAPAEQSAEPASAHGTATAETGDQQPEESSTEDSSTLSFHLAGDDAPAAEAEAEPEPVEPAGWAAAPETRSDAAADDAAARTAEQAAMLAAAQAAAEQAAAAEQPAPASEQPAGAEPAPSEPVQATETVQATEQTQSAADTSQGSAGAAPAGWYADPAGRFELRYWDGTQWTEHVSRAGQQYTDPPVA